MQQNNLMTSKTFKVMVTFPHLLKERIVEHNKLYKTSFKLLEILEDEVPFAVIQFEQETESEIFNLGYGLAVKQYKLKEKGELDW
jgi:hypothetical protein